MHPAARAARVRQRDRDRSAAHVLDLVLAADHLVQRLRAEESVDRQPTDRDDERRAG